MYPLNEKIFDEDEFLSSCVTERPYSWVTEPASRCSSIKDNNKEGTSAGITGSIKMFPEIISSSSSSSSPSSLLRLLVILRRIF
jgi:hypothetical protein